MKPSSVAVPDDPFVGAPESGVLWSKWIVLVLLSYWAVLALAAPMMNYDSEVYNLARLYIAKQGGLFGNHGWNSVRQVIFPWTFDAVHYPFLLLRWGYCLPSFACLLGVCIVVYRAVTTTRPAREGWWCCLALLAMPTLIFQAVCTKNDLAVVFGLGCWYHAWRLWRGNMGQAYLVLMALALGFTAGAKTTGLPFFGLLGAFTLWQMRTNRKAMLRFTGWMALFFVLFGGVEIYLNNLRTYHALFGPPAFILENRNHDGLSGASANFIRYCFGSMNVGIDALNFTSPVSGWLEDGCRAVLHFVGLGGDLGYRKGLGEVDANMRFLKLDLDSATDYGPVGAAALVAALIFVLSRPRTDPVWWLAALGVANLALTSYTVAWMMWNARFLLLSFSLFAVALTLWILRRDTPGGGPRRFWSSAYFCVMVYSAIVYPLHSHSKKPVDVLPMLKHRTVYETSERPAILEMLRDLRVRSSQFGAATVFLHAGGDSWTFCFFELGIFRLVPAPTLDPQMLEAASRPRGGGAGALPVYVVTVNSLPEAAVVPNLVLIKKYDEADSALYQWQPVPSPSP